MMTKKMMQRTAVALLVGALSYGGAGAAQASAAPMQPQASVTSLRDGAQDYQPLRSRDRYEPDRRDRDRYERDRRDRDRWERDRERQRERERRDSRSSGKRYSRGSINTAIVAGAVIGAIIAKNT